MNKFDAEELFEQHMHIAKETLYRMFPNPKGICEKHNIEFDDLLQIAYMGLWRACVSHDPSKSKFMTHAINNVRWYVLERLKRQYGMGTDNDEKYHCVSIDKTLENTEELTMHELIPSDVNVETDATNTIVSNEILKILNRREREIIKLKSKCLTNKEIGQIIGCTGSNVNVLLNKIKEKADNYSNGKPIKPQMKYVISIKGKKYTSIKVAARKLDIKLHIIYYRLSSDLYNDWYYIGKKKKKVNREVV